MAGRILNLISSAEQSDTFEADKIREMPATRFGVFRTAMGKDEHGKSKLIKMVVLSLIGVLGAALGVYFFLNMQSIIGGLGQDSRLSSNYGWGYPFSIGVEKSVALESLLIKDNFYLLLMPSLLIFGVVLSGLFHVVKKWAYLVKEPVYVDRTIAAMFFKPMGRFFKPFLIGIKKNALNFLVIFLLLGGVLVLFNFILKNITEAQIYNGNSAGLIVATIFLCIFLGFYLIMTMYMCTLSATFKMNILIVIKNAALLTIGSLGLVLRNILITALCFAPVALFLIPGMGIIGLMFFAIFGILCIVGFTVYSHWVFEKVGLVSPSVSYAATANAGIDKKAGIIESQVKAENIESTGEKAFSPTTNAQTQNKKNHQSHSKKKKRKR